MTITRTTLLDLPIITSGTETGVWGDITNNGLIQYLDIAVAGMTSLTSTDFTAGALTISTTEGDANATNIVDSSAQYATIKTSSLAANSTITAPASNRSYRIINADSTYTLTIKASGQTGVTFLPGTTGIVAFNGTDYEIVGVVGAASATDNAIPKFDGTTGQIIQNTGVTIDDSNNVSGVAQLNATTVDTTNIEVTNIKAKDGTAAVVLTNSTGAVSFANNVTLGNASTDTVTVNGYMGVGGAAQSRAGLWLTSNALSGGAQEGIVALPVGTSSATATIRAIVGTASTAAASFTATNVSQFWAGDSTKGAGSTITNQHGLYIADQTQGTNNYGITSLVSSGTNKWNIYASGTAANYFAGNVGIGTSSPVSRLQTNSTGGAPNATGLTTAANASIAISSTGAGTLGTSTMLFGGVGSSSYVWLQGQNTGSNTAADIVLNLVGGNVGIGTSSPPEKLSVIQGSGTTTRAIVGGGSQALLVINGDRDNSGDAGEEDSALLLATDGVYDNSVNNGLGTYGFRIGAINDGGSTGVKFTEARNNVDIERMRIDSSGRLLVGATTNINNYLTQIASTTSDSLSILRFAASSGGTEFSLNKSRSGTVGTNTIVQNGDTIGAITFRGADGAGYIQAASITALASGTIASSVMPGALTFNTTAAGGSTPTERMRIDSSGNLLLGGTSTPTASVGNLVMFNGTAPTGNVTNGCTLFCEDVSSSSELKVRDEAGNVTTLSPHNFSVIPEGPSEDMAWAYYSERDGKRINVDMLKAIRLLEKLSGEKLVYES